MSEFDKIIGYETIKNELQQVCDMIKIKRFMRILGQNFRMEFCCMETPGWVKP